KYAATSDLPQLSGTALLHGHCHQKAIMKMTAEEQLLARLGLDVQSPAPGCCGMAGAFGFEADKYDVSMAVGELELLPAVRSAPGDTGIIADGCGGREQIAQGSDRHALHLAEVIQMALTGDLPDPEIGFPEDRIVAKRRSKVKCSMRNAGLGIAGAAAMAGLLWAVARCGSD